MQWYLLVVLIDTGVYASIPFKDAMRCGDALPALHEMVSVDHPDVVVQCIATGTAVTRPRARNDPSS